MDLQYFFFSFWTILNRNAFLQRIRSYWLRFINRLRLQDKRRTASGCKSLDRKITRYIRWYRCSCSYLQRIVKYLIYMRKKKKSVRWISEEYTTNRFVYPQPLERTRNTIVKENYKIILKNQNVKQRSLISYYNRALRVS